MQKSSFLVFSFITGVLLCGTVFSQSTNSVRINLPDSLLIQQTSIIKLLLERKKPDDAFRLFINAPTSQKKDIKKALIQIANEVQGLSKQTKSLLQVTFRNYKDSFHIVTVLYHNSEGRHYLFEIFYWASAKTVQPAGLFLKDPALLIKERERWKETKKKDPSIVLPPSNLPPGLYIKESNGL